MMASFTLSLPSMALRRPNVPEEGQVEDQGEALKPNRTARRRGNLSKLQQKLPVIIPKPKRGAGKQHTPETCGTTPSKVAFEHSPARSVSSKYPSEGRFSTSSDHSQSEHSATHGHLTLASLSSIEQFVETRFNPSWGRSKSNNGVTGQGSNLMEGPAFVTKPQEHSDDSLAITPAPNSITSISDDEEGPPPMPPCPWTIPIPELPISTAPKTPPGSESEGRGLKDKHILSRHLLGIKKWTKVFWKSRASFLEKLNLGKGKKISDPTNEESGNNRRAV
ncbi:hypothetical protein PG987_016150 [Apiospora arundinis]